MDGKNAVWMIAAIGLISVFLFAAFASAQNSERLAAAQGQQSNAEPGQVYAAQQQAFAAPSANPTQALLPSRPGGSCGSGGGGCGCGGGGNQPAAVPAADPAVLPTGVTKRISLGVSGSSYDPSVITVNKGDTVLLEGDMSRLVTCDRSLVIPGYGIRKTFKEGDSVLQFVADKKGTFPFSCSMGMYRGTLIVQ